MPHRRRIAFHVTPSYNGATESIDVSETIRLTTTSLQSQIDKVRSVGRGRYEAALSDPVVEVVSAVWEGSSVAQDFRSLQDPGL